MRKARIALLALIAMLVLPSMSMAGEPPTTTYVVQPGDTLINIGAQFTVDWREICHANNLENCDFVRVGQELVIPLIPPSKLSQKSIEEGWDTFGDWQATYHFVWEVDLDVFCSVGTPYFRFDNPLSNEALRVVMYGPDGLYIGEEAIPPKGQQTITAKPCLWGEYHFLMYLEKHPNGRILYNVPFACQPCQVKPTKACRGEVMWGTSAFEHPHTGGVFFYITQGGLKLYRQNPQGEDWSTDKGCPVKGIADEACKWAEVNPEEVGITIAPIGGYGELACVFFDLPK